ncbi:MAG TPA: hypothetical protein VIH60_01095, partial [Steroidobacteraceae bacterium]
MNLDVGVVTPPKHRLPLRAPADRGRQTIGRVQPQLALPFLGIGSWAYGVSQLRPSEIGSYGLLASANVWFVLGLLV